MLALVAETAMQERHIRYLPGLIVHNPSNVTNVRRA